MASSRQQVQHTYTLSDHGCFVLYGDSIIQQSFSPYTTFSFGAALADIYARKARVKFLLIMFGADDARSLGSPSGPDQSVGVEDFQRNLRYMVCDPSVKAHGENVHIILVTTPPVDERKCMENDQAEYPNLGQTPRRTAANTAFHAQAVRDLGEETGVPVLDIHRAMLALTGHDHLSVPLPGSMEAATNATLQSFLVDGFNFSGEGYRLLFTELMVLIEREWPEAMPNNLPLRLPAWDFHSARKTEVDERSKGETLEWGEEENGAGGSGRGMVGSENMQGKKALMVGKFEGFVSEVR
ncbi:hypothetical protein LTS12_026705 [Elasticomyces elasticus]|nr:hypothetical protein LTS12_026705 [Elasticomyces elasticus]